MKALLAGKLTHKQAAEFTGIGKATVDRIVAAGFNAEQYAKNTAARKQEREEKQAEELRNRLTAAKETASQIKKKQLPIQAAHASEDALKRYREANQIPGQMEMQLLTMNDHSVRAEMKIQLQEVIDEVVRNRTNGLMRFMAEKHDETNKEMDRIAIQLSNIYDMLGQIVRRMKLL